MVKRRWRRHGRKKEPGGILAPGAIILDPNTERYAEAWIAVQPGFSEAYRHELQQLFEPAIKKYRAGAERRTEADEANDGYAMLTGMLFRIEERLSQILGNHTADTLMLSMRRHVVMDVLDDQTQETLDGWRVRQHYFVRAVQLNAQQGISSIPAGGGMHELPVSPQLVADIDIAANLCSTYWLLQGERVRLALGEAKLEFVNDFIPMAVLSDSARAFEHPGGDDSVLNNLLARVGGLSTPFEEMATPDDLDSLATSFMAYGWLPLEYTDVLGAGTASEVRLFGPQIFDGRDVLLFHELLDQQLSSSLGISALELTASLVGVSHLPFLAGAGNAEREFIYRHGLERRAVFTAAKEWVEESLAELVPVIGRSLDPSAKPIDGDELVHRIWPILTTVPEEGDDTTGRLRVAAGTACILDLGDDAVVDLQGLGAGLNTLLNSTSFLGTDAKGPWFEDATRAWLLSHSSELESVPTMETSILRGRDVVGEADVVVRTGDTAFVVECKSRRSRRIGTCTTYDEATSALLPLRKWADQARRTAMEFAGMPLGPDHEVPRDVRWLVPLVCTPQIDLIPPDPNLWIGPEVPIIMSPDQVSAFIASRQWASDESSIEKYRVH